MAEEYYVSKKYHEISLLAQETAERVSKNGEEWAKYLTTAARLYRYPFEEQMLIYAQRPQASACASMEVWNQKMFCWINRGAKGIALFDRESRQPALRYVFDVADVRKLERRRKDLYLWKIREEHKPAVLAWLEETYGAGNSGDSLENRLVEIAEKTAEDSYRELLEALAYAGDNSFSVENTLENDKKNREVRLKETLSAGIAYTLLCRCGADMETWKDRLNLDSISKFGQTTALSVIGNAVTDLCRPILMEIGKTVAAHDRQRAGEKAEERTGAAAVKTEKNPEKTLANTHGIDYNALKHESEREQREEIGTENTKSTGYAGNAKSANNTNNVKNVGNTDSNNKKEMEGKAYGADIRKERGLSNPQPDT